ncbi:MAG: hypothetical protein QW459_04950 [Sulfolobales archaeon]
MRLKAEVYICVADVPELSTYRHVYAAVSKCVSRGIFSISEMPADVAEKLIKRGELLMTELSVEISRLIGVEYLENYQYLRIVLRKE